MDEIQSPQRNNRLLLCSPIPVSVNHYLVPKVIYRGGKAVPIIYETEEAKKYKREFANYVISEVRNQQWSPPEDERRHFYLDCIFYFNRIDMDPNNYFKLLCDAITGSGKVWKDDNIVCERVQGIYYDKENPRIEIEIHPVEYVGIFNSGKDKELFEQKCSDCVRYSKNCSLLTKAIEGRIMPEVQNGQCLKYKKKGVK